VKIDSYIWVISEGEDYFWHIMGGNCVTPTLVIQFQ